MLSGFGQHSVQLCEANCSVSTTTAATLYTSERSVTSTVRRSKNRSDELESTRSVNRRDGLLASEQRECVLKKNTQPDEETTRRNQRWPTGYTTLIPSSRGSLTAGASRSTSRCMKSKTTKLSLNYSRLNGLFPNVFFIEIKINFDESLRQMER